MINIFVLNETESLYAIPYTERANTQIILRKEKNSTFRVVKNLFDPDTVNLLYDSSNVGAYLSSHLQLST